MSHVCWAYESEMDDIARRLHVDPLELRLNHLVQEGDTFVTGEKLVSVGLRIACVGALRPSAEGQPATSAAARAAKFSASKGECR